MVVLKKNATIQWNMVILRMFFEVVLTSAVAQAVPMTPPEAFRAVLPNTSSASLLDPAQREREFQQVSALASQVAVFHLRTEIGFQRLEETKRVVRSTVRAVTPRA